MPSLVNRLVFRELERDLGTAKGALFMTFGGLTVKESEHLRGKLAEKGVRVRMVRNALARRVLSDRGISQAADVLAGNTAIAWGGAEAAIHASKIVSEPEVKKHGKVKIRAGMLDGQWLGEKDAIALSKVPDRKTLQAQILGCLSGPARGLVMTLNGLPSGLTRVLNSHAEKLTPEAGASPDAAPAGEASA
ncbi:MAG: 50S ribosomal protein L10 [Planctomycetota bacterium]